MSINSIKLLGEYNQIKNGAISLGVDPVKARSMLIAIRNAFKELSCDVFITKPREMIGVNECSGSIIVATPDKICKGILIKPSSCADDKLLDKYLAGAKKLAAEDYSPSKNVPEFIDWIV